MSHLAHGHSTRSNEPLIPALNHYRCLKSPNSKPDVSIVNFSCLRVQLRRFGNFLRTNFRASSMCSSRCSAFVVTTGLD